MIISSRKNPAVTRFRELNRERRERGSSGCFNLEGVRICCEAVQEKLVIVSALVTETAAEKYPEAYAQLRAVCSPEIITDDIGSYISDTKSPQGFFITAKKLDNSAKMCKINSGRLMLLDGLQDAGNIGTIIRTCDALGIDGLVLSPECADVYSPKVVRGAMGSLFRLPFTVAPLPCFIAGLQSEGFSVYAAILDRNAKPLPDMRFPENCAVVIGNEGNGVSDAVISAADGGIYIPIENAESLNAAAAAAIFCYALRR